MTEEKISARFDESFEPIDLLDVCPKSSLFGNDYFVITDEEIELLKSGKILHSGGEYGTFIKYMKSK